MNPAEILRRSRTLAQSCLTASLAEIKHELANGMDQGRLTRFADLAAEADALLGAEVKPPKGHWVGHPATADRVVRVVSQAQRVLPVNTKPEARPALAVRLLKQRGDWVTTKELGKLLAIPDDHVSGTITNARKVAKIKIEGERGKGYRIALFRAV